ncbi:hypothetical protein [Bradyrhizobium sp. 18]|uniref:hypothetical protein n=1 Tax=Bradyrhizobium sp. 18 TaxID=2782657 RepID=UPI001FF7679B|nr:hypothetical protein [Bradyrhizobium sp. 18]
MTDPRDNQWSAKTASAVLAACIVRTIEETDPTFADRFLANVDRAYNHFRDNPVMWKRKDGSPRDLQDVLEALSWTNHLITGWNPITGQGEPFLKD